jgi:hypothetical protein
VISQTTKSETIEITNKSSLTHFKCQKHILEKKVNSLTILTFSGLSSHN